MCHCPPKRVKPITFLLWVFALLTVLAPAACADEGGVSFWLPGQYGSFAGTPPPSGFSLTTMTYRYSGRAGGELGRGGGRLTVGLDADALGQFIVPTYTSKGQFLGGTPSFSLAFAPMASRTKADLTLGPWSPSRSDSVTGLADLYPTAQIYWNKGVHNWMAYGTGNIPVGSYDKNRLANLGIGHAAIDMGGAYTYLNPESGWEFSTTVGLTYNFENPHTNYRNGLDSHLDVGVSKFLTEKFYIGGVGYAYQQLTADSGQAPFLGENKSRVFGVGPQIGYMFGPAERPMFTNLKAYFEFGAERRVQGTGAFLTVNAPF